MLEQVRAVNVMLVSMHLYQVRQRALCVQQDIRVLTVGGKKFVQLDLMLLLARAVAIDVGMRNIAQLRGVVRALHVLLALFHRQAIVGLCSHHRQPRAISVLWEVIVMVLQL